MRAYIGMQLTEAAPQLDIRLGQKFGYLMVATLISVGIIAPELVLFLIYGTD
ncbi:MAG: hypothetical protein ACI89X_000540 [Planctomycetota bacterium]|jgi:hypothetical protein